MPIDGAVTKERIFDAANALFLERGIAATSLGRIASDAGVTKGSFFYHFKDKDDLVIKLVERFAETDRAHYEHAISRLETLGVSDPLQRLITFVGVFVEAFEDLEDPPGCLFATYLFEQGIVSEEAMKIVRGAFFFWREKVSELIDAAIKKYPPQEPIAVAEVADLFTSVVEGAFIMSKVMEDASIPAKHIQNYQRYLQLLFETVK